MNVHIIYILERVLYLTDVFICDGEAIVMSFYSRKQHAI